MADHIHTVDDGRGQRDVFVDGKKIEHVFYADTRRGIVDYYPWPPKVHKWKKEIISRRLRGRVEVRNVNDG